MSAPPVGGLPYVEVPCTPCLAAVDALGWSRTIGLFAGGGCLGVRVNSEGLGDLIEELFADRVVAGVSPPDNLSLRLEPIARHGPQHLHALYWLWLPMLRSRSPRRMLDALWQELDAQDARATGGRVLIDATVLCHNGRVHLLPASLRERLVDEARAWERDGLQLVDRRWLELDPAAGSVTIPDSGIDWDHELLHRMDGLGVDDRMASAAQPTGCLPIASWTHLLGDATPALRAVEAAKQVLDRPALGSSSWLQELTELLGQVPRAATEWTGLDDLRCGLLDV